jgi:cytochrome b6-f complex iron-sulfur subunit
MERLEFIKLMGTGTLLACAGCGLTGCGSDDDPAPANIDLTLDLSLSENAALQNVGGSLSRDGIIIARLSATEFAAVSRACTHEGVAVNFRPTPRDFYCSAHGSVFSTSGAVVQGPASRPLRQYQTAFTGNILRVTA